MDVPGSDSPKNQAEELKRLCERFPVYRPQDLDEDRAWLLERLKTGVLGGVYVTELQGRIVAVCDKLIVAVGDNEVAMRVELSKRFQLHPGRFVLVLIERNSHRFLGEEPVRRGCGVTPLEVLVMFALWVIVDIASITALGSNANETFSTIGTPVNLGSPPAVKSVPTKR